MGVALRDDFAHPSTANNYPQGRGAIACWLGCRLPYSPPPTPPPNFPRCLAQAANFHQGYPRLLSKATFFEAAFSKWPHGGCLRVACLAVAVGCCFFEVERFRNQKVKTNEFVLDARLDPVGSDNGPAKEVREGAHLSRWVPIRLVYTRRLQNFTISDPTAPKGKRSPAAQSGFQALGPRKRSLAAQLSSP